MTNICTNTITYYILAEIKHACIRKKCSNAVKMILIVLLPFRKKLDENTIKLPLILTPSGLIGAPCGCRSPSASTARCGAGLGLSPTSCGPGTRVTGGAAAPLPRPRSSPQHTATCSNLLKTSKENYGIA